MIKLTFITVCARVGSRETHSLFTQVYIGGMLHDLAELLVILVYTIIIRVIENYQYPIMINFEADL